MNEFKMDYTEILRLQAKSMLAQLARESGNKAYEDERLLECMHGAFCIIRNDTRTSMIADMLTGNSVQFKLGTDAEKAQWRALSHSYISAYAMIHGIALPDVGKGTT